MRYDVEAIRQDFPILQTTAHQKPLVYLDNAATSQKPQIVIDTLLNYYKQSNANIHRGAHYLAAKATEEYEQARETIRHFLGADSADEIILLRGVTEAINLIANTYGESQIQEGDEIILSVMEHHSNIVPWQMLCERKKAILKVIPINEKGELELQAYEKMLSERTKIVSIAHASNALGSIHPIKKIIDLAHQKGAIVVIDGAQGAVHLDIDVQELDCDFYAFSGHKVYAPTGVGALYGKRKILEAMPPYHGGGEMIKEVSFEKTTYNGLPFKFEAGTPNIADVIAFKAGLDYVQKIGKQNIHAHEDQLLQHATKQLNAIEGLSIIGTAAQKVSVVSFVVEGCHHGDLGTLLDAKGIAVRTGHHCAQPLMAHLGIKGTVRASFAMYNTLSEIDQLAVGIQSAIKMLK